MTSIDYCNIQKPNLPTFRQLIRGS